MRIQLWSYNYDPEPQGVAPLSAVLARTLAERGHDVLVVAAHPHYPEPTWGSRRRPYRERRDGVPVLRLPLWIGRATGLERVRQELSFAVSLALAAPVLPACDAVIAVSPSFPAQAVAMAYGRVRRVPWILWLQDIVTDGAASTGLLPAGALLRAAQRFERSAYASADRVVVISEAFRRNLRGKGVADGKLVRILNPTTFDPSAGVEAAPRDTAAPRILAMGNIGHSQGLDRVVDAFEASGELARLGARLVIAGAGVEAETVRSRIVSDRVSMTGVLHGDALAAELAGAWLGLVSQRPDVAEFNLPSKLMNYMACGVPVIASVRPESETAALIRESGAGWITDAADPAALARQAAAALEQPEALRRHGAAGRDYARAHFRPQSVAERFEAVLEGVLAARQPSR